ncbi:MAG: rhamnogalacturonan acetylesterase [Flaviaesturariibacter sp.]|nr:rhamnogalacturonan acetylesterase [Flaviaesturariibacter sp.]
MKRVAAFLSLALLSFGMPPAKKIKVWLVGDSTCANKEVRAYPETGWGMPFSSFFDSTITVDNRAKNGRSTKSFRAEGLWAPVLNQLSEGDYVFLQFGHNDEGKEKVGRYTTPEEFKANLLQYVMEARAKKALPVLLTPVARRTFDANGNVTESHPVYSDVVRAVAREAQVPLIDLDAQSMALLQSMGKDASAYLYNHLAPGEHPNYPDGRSDDTHFNELGARKMAGLVLAGIRELKLGLADHISKPVAKKP